MANFIPRMTKPEKGNPYYTRKVNGGYSDAIKGNPADPDCDVLSNCVGYAYGRFNEIGGYGCCKYLKPVNAENFIQYCGGLPVGQTPKLGSCMVWQKGATLSGSDGAGHVAIVEKVISQTEVVTSESGWGDSNPFYMATRKKGADGNWGQSYKFLGFIYNPAVTDESTPEPEPQPKPQPRPTDKIEVGDVVDFTGNTHYRSSGAAVGFSCKPGKATVTKIVNGHHPYHVICTPNGGSTVYGWVDAKDIAIHPQTDEKEIKAGSIVRVKEGARAYDGTFLASFVYKRNHTVKSISGDRVVITYNGVVVAAMHMDDLILV